MTGNLILNYSLKFQQKKKMEEEKILNSKAINYELSHFIKATY